MKRIKMLLRILFASFVIIGLFFASGFLFQKGKTLDKPLSLQPPPFLSANVVKAAPAGVSAKLDAEAGISAWYQSADPINLGQIKSTNTFKTIEIESSDYIIGSVDVPNYGDNFDVHVYVHKDGWILAYYLKADPIAKMIDSKSQSINGTLLKSVVSIVAGNGGIPFNDVTYYDFRYPSANKMLIVAENESGGNEMKITIPSAYGYFERSWALADFTCCGMSFKLDGTANPNHLYWVDNVGYGTISASQLLPDVEHTILVDSYGVLVIAYRE